MDDIKARLTVGTSSVVPSLNSKKGVPCLYCGDKNTLSPFCQKCASKGYWLKLSPLMQESVRRIFNDGYKSGENDAVFEELRESVRNELEATIIADNAAKIAVPRMVAAQTTEQKREEIRSHLENIQLCGGAQILTYSEYELRLKFIFRATRTGLMTPAKSASSSTPLLGGTNPLLLTGGSKKDDGAIAELQLLVQSLMERVETLEFELKAIRQLTFGERAPSASDASSA